MSIFHLKFKKFQKNFFETTLAFSIGNIKSRVPSVGQVILHCFDVHGNEITTTKVAGLTANPSIIQTGESTDISAYLVDGVDGSRLSQEGVKIHFYKKVEPEFELEASPEIIQSGDTTDISCTVTEHGRPITGQKVHFYKKVDGDSQEEEEEETIDDSYAMYVGERFVITDKYNSHVENISLTANVLAETYEMQIELVLYGLDSENPCWFNQLMLETGEHTEYHKPDEAMAESRILFNNNNYAILYSDETHSLQVIRPLPHDDITTKKLLKSDYTILAPHIDGEPATDTPSNLMMEFINQTEQKITNSRIR